MESKARMNSIFTRDIQVSVVSHLSLFPSPCFRLGHWLSQAGGVSYDRKKWILTVNLDWLTEPVKPNKIVAPNSYLQELLCAISNSGSYSVYT